MEKYRVHVFATVRIPVEVEAESQQAAIEKAKSAHDYYNLLLNIKGSDSEDGEEFTGFLVDEIGDTEYAKSRWYTADGQEDGPALQCRDCDGSGNIPAHTDDNQAGYARCEKCQGTGMDIAKAEAIAEQQGQDWASAGEDQQAGKNWS